MMTFKEWPIVEVYLITNEDWFLQSNHMEIDTYQPKPWIIDESVCLIKSSPQAAIILDE